MTLLEFALPLMVLAVAGAGIVLHRAGPDRVPLRVRAEEPRRRS